LAEQGVSIAVVHGGITTLQKHSFGKLTVRLNGNPAAIEEFYNTLQQTTEIEEISR
ncbi:NIL domain-containing protein, partial [Corynebacterium striatum]